MEKFGHENLFAYGDREEVYAALQRDFDRDTWVQHIWQLVFVGMAAGAAIFSNHADWLWLFGGIYAVERAISALHRQQQSQLGYARH